MTKQVIRDTPIGRDRPVEIEPQRVIEEIEFELRQWDAARTESYRELAQRIYAEFSG